MKYAIALGLLALPFCLCADGEAVDARVDDQKNMGTRGPAQVTLSSARPESENGWYLFADALYWHADIGSTDWVIPSILTGTGRVQSNRQRSLNFKWDWAFRAGVVANMAHDKWDMDLYYTWFHTSTHDKASSVLPQEMIDLLFEHNTFQSGRIHWDIHYSMLDWELGKWYYVSNDLALRPHIGIKGGWINQKVKGSLLQALAIGTIKERAKNDFWGVGPSFGANTLWVLGRAGAMNQHRLSFFGDCGGALMYGHFRVKFEDTVLATGTVTPLGLRIPGLNRNLAVVMLHGIFGFSWDVGFNKDRDHFTFKIGYELEYWFRQNQLLVVTSGFTNGTRRLSDDLALQGLTIDFQFNF